MTPILVTLVNMTGNKYVQFDNYDGGGADGNDDIYIMMHVCLFVKKNEHFLLEVSCNHLNPP